MSENRDLTVTVSAELVRRVRERVAADEYASESDVIREGLKLLLGDDPAFEAWLRTEAAAAYDALVADPSRALSIDEARGNLAALRGRTTG
jgi:antitoxin ParD1/3/4